MTTTTAPDAVYIKKEPHSGQRCVHCQRECGNLAGGFARFKGEPVCSRPTDPDRPDCFRMITVKFHPVYNCPHCMDTTPEDYPTVPRSFGPRGI